VTSSRAPPRPGAHPARGVRGCRVSLGYLSEVERGQKEASSELLGAICDALDVPMSEVMREVSDHLAVAEGIPVVPALSSPGRCTSPTSLRDRFECLTA
jgi:transcriptional regulator with XRE-family HTH domain